MRIALPFPPQALRAARAGKRASRRLSITPSTASASSPAPADAGSARAAVSSSQVANGTSGERSMRGSSSRAMKRFEPRAPLGERQLAQILVAVDQQIVGAQMRGKFGEQLRR